MEPIPSVAKKACTASVPVVKYVLDKVPFPMLSVYFVQFKMTVAAEMITVSI